MFSVALLMAALGGWGQGGGCPGGFCPDPGPGSMPMFMQPPPVFLPAAPPMGVFRQPPIQNGLVSGKITKVEIEHPDGSRWWYTFAVPKDATATLDASNHNALVHVVSEGVTIQKPAVKDEDKGKACTNKNCKCSPPCSCFDCKCYDANQVVGQLPPGGVNKGELEKSRQKYDSSITGRPCTTKEAIKAMEKGRYGDGTVPDDSKLLRLSYIDPDKAKREAVRKSFETDKAFDGIRQAVVLATYDPKDPMVPKEFGFTEGTLLTEPDGKAIASTPNGWNAEVYAGEIRKRDPNFDPNKVPDPTKPSPAPIIPSMPNIDLQALSRHPLVLIAAAFAALMFLSRKPV